ncbi:hypothetical protein FE257_005673 [Aspergillus nanangensis]|uniref:Histidine acid phosphatase n=1 Tax=Aspergillus nanangensis TaxID=2582783 RepID=A0AAD4CQD0_ASPNN|nr:hypothetical protein FE257_005673 [Aspergillus nanangensis]
MLLSLSLFASLLMPVTGETILGVTVYSRHGDRSSKHYSGYGLTNLGLQQNFRVGADYRDLYISSDSSKQILGISEDKFVASQLYASAPDQSVLLNTATAFLQGLYPPLDGLDTSIASQTLNNGSDYKSPLNGYQYVTLHGEEEESPDTIWIKGDDSCPSYTEAAATFEHSVEYQETMASTRDFYAQFWPMLEDVYDYTRDDLTYANAYDIFDLINVASIHNASFAPNVTDEQLFQLRTLANSAEFAENFNVTQPARSIGGQTVLSAILTQLNETVASQGKRKFSLLAGSYDTMLAVFGVTELISLSHDFYGLPEYASTMAFEILTEENTTSFPEDEESLRVRFLFRNGSDAGAPLTAFPLFGRDEVVLSWRDFVAEMQKRAVTSVEDWCKVCRSTQDFCSLLTRDDEAVGVDTSKSGGAISNAVAGVIGAVVTLAVVGVIGGVAWFVLRRKRAAVSRDMQTATLNVAEKGSLSSGSTR